MAWVNWIVSECFERDLSIRSLTILVCRSGGWRASAERMDGRAGERAGGRLDGRSVARAGRAGGAVGR